MLINGTTDSCYIQSEAAGLDTGNGEKLSNSLAFCLAGVAWGQLNFSPFPLSNPEAPPCTIIRKNAAKP